MSAGTMVITQAPDSDLRAAQLEMKYELHAGYTGTALSAFFAALAIVSVLFVQNKDPLDTLVTAVDTGLLVGNGLNSIRHYFAAGAINGAIKTACLLRGTVASFLRQDSGRQQ